MFLLIDQPAYVSFAKKIEKRIQLYQKYRELVELQRPLVDSLGLFEVITEVGEMR